MFAMFSLQTLSRDSVAIVASRLQHERYERHGERGLLGMADKHWRGDFHPAILPATRWLEHYATHFDTVEINNSFYRLPLAETFGEWRRRVPSSFVYAVKASRYLTHMKKLKDPGPPVALFFSRARRLGRRLGPVLYQLPPRWPRNPNVSRRSCTRCRSAASMPSSFGIRAGMATTRSRC